MLEQLVKEVISDISQREDRQRNRRDDAQHHFEYAVRYLLTELWKASKSIPFRESKINRNRNYYSSQPERYRDSNLTYRQVIAAFEGLLNLRLIGKLPEKVTTTQRLLQESLQGMWPLMNY